MDLRLTSGREIWKWLIIILISGGILAVFVDHFLDQIREPKSELVTNVTTSLIESATSSSVETIIHEILVRNDGDTVFNNLELRFRFSPTSGKPTISSPVTSARPTALLENDIGKWINSQSYGMDITKLAPGAEISLTFESDQILITSIDIISDSLQATRTYNQ